MKWISVKESLPVEGDQVLTCDRSPSHWEFRLDYIVLFPGVGEGYIWARRLIDDWSKVTHWMPLPLPPEEKDE